MRTSETGSEAVDCLLAIQSPSGAQTHMSTLCLPGFMKDSFHKMTVEPL